MKGLAVNPYHTHLRVLSLIPKKIMVRTILEFGSGYSTGIFLNKSVYPDLENIITFEPNKPWFDRIPTDFRLRGYLCSEDEALTVSDGKNVDLAFVDGESPSMRVPTVLHVKKLAKITVLHDSDNFMYSSVFKEFKYVLTDSTKSPNTSVFSDKVDCRDWFS